jgi:hypothetical protein
MHASDQDMLIVSYVDREVCFLLLRIGGNHIPGYASVRRVTAMAIILFLSALVISKPVQHDQYTYAPSRMRKLVSFCIRVLPQPMAISGILQTTLAIINVTTPHLHNDPDLPVDTSDQNSNIRHKQSPAEPIEVSLQLRIHLISGVLRSIRLLMLDRPSRMAAVVVHEMQDDTTAHHHVDNLSRYTSDEETAARI